MAKTFVKEHGSQILEQRDEAINNLIKCTYVDYCILSSE